MHNDTINDGIILDSLICKYLKKQKGQIYIDMPILNWDIENIAKKVPIIKYKILFSFMKIMALSMNFLIIV